MNTLNIFNLIGGFFGAIFGAIGGSVGWIAHTTADKTEWLWTTNRLWFLLIIGGLLAYAGGWVLWKSFVALRAKNAQYDEYKCTHMPNGSPRSKPVKLNLGLVRSVTWPGLILPLYLQALAMAYIQFHWMSIHTWALLSVYWFVTTPLRTMLKLRALRRAYLRRNPGEVFTDDLWDTAVNYYRIGLVTNYQGSTPKTYEAPFWDTTVFWKIGNRLHRFVYNLTLLRYLLSMLRFWEFWFMPLHAITCWLWPISNLLAISWHAGDAEDLSLMLKPKWRRSRGAFYDEKTVPGTVIYDDASAGQAANTGTVVAIGRTGPGSSRR